MLERRAHVLDEALVEGAEVLGREAERVMAREMMEVPAHELPIEAVVVGYEYRLATQRSQPLGETRHLLRGISERQRVVARPPADRERFGKPALRNRT